MKLARLLVLSTALVSASALAGPIATYQPASPLNGTEKILATQATKSVNITPAQIKDYAVGAITTLPNLASAPNLTSLPNLTSAPNLVLSVPALQNGAFIGLGKDISTTNLTTYIVNGVTAFSTTGFYTAGDAGAARYYRNTGSARPCDKISLDGIRLSLVMSQQLTWEQCGAPNTGWIGTGSISGGVFTPSATQSGALAAGMTLTEVGGGTAVNAATKIVSAGAGSTWNITPSQTVTSRVMVANDSAPYVADALQLGVNKMVSIGPHWFSKATVIKGSPARWSGTNGYGNGSNGFTSTWYYPSGYSCLVAIPDNYSSNAQGDLSSSGSVTFGGASGWSVDHIFFQVGNHNFPASSVNHRPCIAIYTPGSLSNWQSFGADGDGLLIFGDAPNSIADKNLISDFTIANAYDNGIETRGGDGNTTEFRNGIISTVGASGIYEHGFLGNTYIDMQGQTTGQVSAIVRRSNYLYYSLQDGNINHDPLTSPSYWGQWLSSPGTDSWSSGATYQVGACFRTSGGGNVTQFYSPYCEGDAPPPLLQALSGTAQTTSVYGGLLANGQLGGNLFGNITIARGFVGYQNDGYSFDTGGGNGFFVGYRANNVNGGGGSPVEAGYDVAINGTCMGRFGGKSIYNPGQPGIGGSNAVYLASCNAGGTLTYMLFADANQSTIGPWLDSTYDLGLPAFRWRNVYATNLVGSGSITTSVGPIGYVAGAGGAVTQATSRTTGVTLNKPTGAITLFSAAGSATPFTFTVTNSAVALTDTVRATPQKGTTDKYRCDASVAAGNFDLTCVDLTGTATEAPVINYNVIKGAAS